MFNLMSLKRFLSLLMITAFSISSPVVMADDDDSDVTEIVTSITSMDIDFSGDDKELVHYWLYEMFGDFIFAPWDSSYEDSTDITLLSKAVGYTSILAMILGVIIVYYVMIGGALNTAHSGQALGQQWSSVWVPIRTSAGFFMIMPISSVGGGVFSFAQMFILWVIILGSNAATVLWDNSVDNLLSPSTKSVSMQVGVKPSADIFRMLACTDRYISYASNVKGGYFSSSDFVVAKVWTKTDDDYFSHVSKVISASTSSSSSESFVASATSLASAVKQDDVIKVVFGPSGSCGQIEFPEDDDSVGDDIVLDVGYKREIINTAVQSSKSAISELISSHIEILSSLGNDMDVITSIVEDKVKNEDSGTYITMYDAAFDMFYSATETFANSLEYNINKNIVENETLTEQWQEEIKEGGWGKAGVWFYEVNSISMMGQKALNTLIDGINASGYGVCNLNQADYGTKDVCEDAMQDYTQMKALSALFTVDGMEQAETDNDQILIGGSKVDALCESGRSCEPDDGELRSTTNEMAIWIINLLADGSPASSTDSDGGRNELTSPFQTVSSIGVTLNNYSLALWTTAALTNGAIEATNNGLKDSVAGFFGGGAIGGFIYGVGKFTIASIVLVAMSVAGSGFILAYLIPFLPVVTWIMMVTGYLITVVEAVIAAPLAIILMATPEGDGISGTRLERAMQLLAMAVLKPSLMIIGLIAAVAISGISFGIMNQFFFETAEHVLSGGPIDVVAVVILYTTTSFQLCKMLVSIMHKLPEQILDWFSSGVGRSFGEGDIGGMVEGSQSDAKSFMSNAGSGLGSTLKESIRDKKRAKNLNGGASEE
ncbi:DotA/TraY family protein [Psychromonas sp. SP041]|uniref:DotA/TraY family protein n=1 Tax=Psychromonas sp. SP041 TaxID=1365007 RepID=UPI0010C7DB55|nr:DotA/TraY family protein [Psychromonas sp. SP041]